MLGIVGGMGPLASAEFLKTIYELNIGKYEQEAPACILYSDPGFPDRTATIASGLDEPFVSSLLKALETLSQLGSSKIVIACITSHHFLPQLPPQLRDKVISLVDLIVEEILHTKKRTLLLGTSGMYKAAIFQQHVQWAAVHQYITIPAKEDQTRIHKVIYQIKKNCIDDTLMSFLTTLVQKYAVDSLIAGCTEIHLLTKKHLLNPSCSDVKYQIIDPLLLLAQNLGRYLDGENAFPG